MILTPLGEIFKADAFRQKTKSIGDILEFAALRPVVISWKFDGLTLVLRYEGGEFKKAVTRGGDGLVGENVKMNQASRLLEQNFESITEMDLTTITSDDIVIPTVKKTEKQRIGFC